MSFKKYHNFGFTLIEMIVTITILMVVMSGATTFFINFINTQVKGVSYLNILNENMTDMQFLVRKMKQATSVRTLEDFHQSDEEYPFHSLLIRNSSSDFGPYSLFTTVFIPDPEHLDVPKRFLAIKDFFIFNDVLYDASNNALFYADTGNHVIRRIDLQDKKVQIYAGVKASPGFSEGSARESQLNLPMGIALDDEGSLYIADTGNHRIRKVDSQGLMTTVIGSGTPSYNESESNNVAIENNVNYPTDVEVGTDGSIYFVDSGNNRVRKITSDGFVSTLAGNGSYGFRENDDDAVDAPLNTPVALTLDEQNNVYFTDSYNSRIAKITADTGELINVAGSVNRTYSGDDGNAIYAKFNIPTGIEYYDGKLYVSDTSNHLIRYIEPMEDGIIGTFDDKVRLAAGFNGRVFVNPGKDILDDSDDVYTTTFEPMPGFLEGLEGDGAPAISSQTLFNNPSGLVFDDEGNLFIMDSLNNRLRVVASEDNPTNVSIGNDIKAGYIYTLLGNPNIDGLDQPLLFRNVDYTAFVFDGVNDYVGQNTVSTLKFFTPDMSDLSVHPYVDIQMTLSAIDYRDGSDVNSELNTTVSLRRYRY